MQLLSNIYLCDCSHAFADCVPPLLAAFGVARCEPPARVREAEARTASNASQIAFQASESC
jgi:hypothetical protein